MGQASTVYTVDLTNPCTSIRSGNATVQGFIEMDHLGSGLTAANILDWQFTMTSPSFTQTSMLDPTATRIRQIRMTIFTATDLTITASAGFFGFDPSVLGIQATFGYGTDSSGLAAIMQHRHGGGATPADIANPVIGNAPSALGSTAAITPVPLPAGLRLSAGALVTGAIASLRRKA